MLQLLHEDYFFTYPPLSIARGDMTFFKKITTETSQPDKQNAVIMGRKTWESIPEKFRPLQKRVNVILSRHPQKQPDGVYVAGSFDEAINMLTSVPLLHKVDKLFVIGGSSVYKTALQSLLCQRIYLTRVLGDFECDTFFPEFDMSIFKQINVPEIDSAVQTENQMEYKFEVYEKISATLCDFNIVVAVSSNRGFGKDGQLPWPPIKKDYNHFTSLMARTRDPGKKCVAIHGRISWYGTTAENLSSPKLMHIVVSTTLKETEPNAYAVARSLGEALKIARTLVANGIVETVWLLGGETLFKEAVRSEFCRMIYITRIDAEFDSDRFFPDFEDQYRLTSDSHVDPSEQEDNGIKFRFEVYENLKPPVDIKGNDTDES
ncbi:Viral dihydrofolate reductase [Lamellibrachia satsuma]|nr:Viral dihydrofolate reductase [Lamellibrachia satsuma]